MSGNKNLVVGHRWGKGADTKTNWPTDCRSQYNLNLNLSKIVILIPFLGARRSCGSGIHSASLFRTYQQHIIDSADGYNKYVRNIGNIDHMLFESRDGINNNS
jgi:hypothetical protein